jgi:hypothetical protein
MNGPYGAGLGWAYYSDLCLWMMGMVLGHIGVTPANFTALATIPQVLKSTEPGWWRGPADAQVFWGWQ